MLNPNTGLSPEERLLNLRSQTNLRMATFAGGCFWCIEGPFEAKDGVVEAMI